jgi:hypothetical protein
MHLRFFLAILLALNVIFVVAAILIWGTYLTTGRTPQARGFV